MRQNYNFAVTELLKSEGGYTNDPSDSGGATNFGITIGDYRKYINKNGTPNDVKNMTVAQAKSIYKTKYWDAIGGDTLSNGVDYSAFDYGVLAGLGRPRTALERFKDLTGDKLIDAINDERTGFLTRLATNRPKDQKFLHGWLTRTERVRTQSHKLFKNTDKTSGPVAGGTVALSTWAIMTQYIHNHPYLVVAGAVAVAVAIGFAVHYFRNKSCSTSTTPTSTLPSTSGGLPTSGNPVGPDLPQASTESPLPSSPSEK